MRPAEETRLQLDGIFEGSYAGLSNNTGAA
jgi:hypothetical protein